MLNQEHEVRNRVLLDILILVLIYCTPWWLSLPLVVVVAFFFPFYIEIILAGLIIDTLYGSQYYILTISAAAIFFISGAVRKRLRV